MRTIFLFFILLLAAGCHDTKKEIDDTLAPTPAVPFINYEVKASFPHDTTLFTEGLLMHDGKLFESTGSPDDMPNAKSMIGISDLSTGKFEKKVEIDKKLFGEGIVFLNNKLYQLTYESQVGFIYDATTYKQTGRFTFKNSEGWGLTTNGKEIIMSDGTEYLTFLDPGDLKPIRTLRVTEKDNPLKNINELEFIKGSIYANVWQTNNIVKIDTATGKVIGKLNLEELTNRAKIKRPGIDVLNGIAYDAASGKLFVTGKLWPDIYELDIPL